MSLVKCPECGKDISSEAFVCPNCGYSFEETKFCKFCGEKIPADSVVCTKCGRQVENVTSINNGGITINNAATSSASSTSQVEIRQPISIRPQKEIDKNTALILCIFLGYFGVHKFYEGKVGMGILYLCTMGLFGIGWIIDIIIIATKPNPYYV